MAITKDDLSKLTCAEIRVQLKERNLRLYGLKSELINRLWDDMQQDDSGGDDNDINNFNAHPESEIEVKIEVEKSNGEQSSSPPTLQSSAAASSSSTTTTTTNNNRWYYPLAILPLPLILFLSSHLLRNTITSPPSNYGSGSMFDLIATRYDFINRALALNLDMGWRHRLVDEVVGVSGEIFQKNGNEDEEDVRFLDLATGTADVAILLGKAATKYNYQPPPSSSTSTSTPPVLGLDPSNNMLNVGKSKVQQFDLTSTVQLDLGDARDLNKIPNDTFNVATMSFGIRNVPEKEVALCEIHRVLKKKSTKVESKLAIMEFSEPGLNSGVLGSLARLFIRHLVPAMGALLSGYPKEYMHLQKSIKDFPSPAEFVELMEGIKCPIKAEDGGVDQLEQIDTWGSFRVKEVVNLNFGSVQIYIANPILKQMVTE